MTVLLAYIQNQEDTGVTAWTGRTEFEIKENRLDRGEVRIPTSSSKRMRR